MKKLIAFAFIGLTVCFSRLAAISDQTILVSHVKSGRNWFEYSIQELTGKKVKWFSTEKVRRYPSLSKDIWVSHSPRFFPIFPPQNNRLVVTLRNYKEVIARFTRDFEGGQRIKELLNPVRHKNYLSYVRFFDRWNPSMRYLYYYEDMMANPQAKLQELLNFMGESDYALLGFIEAIDDHRVQSIKRTHAGSMSYGVPIFHTKEIPKEVLIKMDEVMKRLAGPLYNKYLKRFKEPLASNA